MDIFEEDTLNTWAQGLGKIAMVFDEGSSLGFDVLVLGPTETAKSTPYLDSRF